MTENVAPFGPIDRRQFAQLCAGSLALATAGCGRGGKRARASRSTITVLYPIDERGLGPAAEMSSKMLVFLPLTVQSENGEMEGRLAERWEHSPDYRTWTIHLRRGVRWHDGVPVTARDIKFTMDLLSHPAVLWKPPNAFSTTVLDDSTFTITYHKDSGDPLDGWTVGYPKHLLETLEPKEFLNWEFWKHPVGNGPYRYVRTVPKTAIELEANPDDYRGKPRIDRVVLKFGKSSLTELLSGNVDVLGQVNQADLLKIATDRRFRAYHEVSPVGLLGIAWNQHSALFREAIVRRALTLAIDRGELRGALNLPADLPIFDVVFTDRQYWRREMPEPLPCDPELAKRLLEEAGWRDRDGDGVRERGDKKFRFVAIAAKGSTLEQAAVFVQAQLRQVGVRMEVQTLDTSVMGRWLRSGDFEAAFFNFWNRVDGHLRWFGEGSPIGSANPRVAELLRAVKATGDPDKIDRFYRALMPVLAADLPITFLFPQVVTYVAHERVRGLRSPFRADALRSMEDLWLEDER